MPSFPIRPLQDTPAIRRALGELLVETVAGGGSVSFMHPLPLATAETFWMDSLASASRGERIVLGAFDGDTPIATVTLLLNLPPNQPHRAEIAKMMTRTSHRHRGVAQKEKDMKGARQKEDLKLFLDHKAVDEGASGLYENM
jgi:hypothetical protein